MLFFINVVIGRVKNYVPSRFLVTCEVHTVVGLDRVGLHEIACNTMNIRCH